jgi:hypothetical protein
MERYMFNRFPSIRDDEPMGETKFWKWLEENHKVEGNSIFINAIQGYLEPYGFDIKKYYLPSYQTETHRIVFEHFWWIELRKDKK